ncbi:MAG: CbiX/SirB N-terminal domain-containing protein [Deltaproteobacteria bacterium]|nr:CbiX/SirB N-terminal domain-containing protein [Deltaproteobacteria bacterium]MCL6119865.1 CbiX/SirB N-terminal domain-containing protein [Deltaproteobacteria bacterium]
MKESVVLLGHGSRRSDANDILRNMTDIIKSKVSFEDIKIECAYLEFAEPNINDMLEKLAEENFDSIYVIPYFLYSGNHVSRDIPEILRKYGKKYPYINFKLGDYLGVDERIADLVAEKIAAVKPL